MHRDPRVRAGDRHRGGGQAPAPRRGRRRLGLTATPQLATLRARLSALADGSDPLAVQRAFAARMLGRRRRPARRCTSSMTTSLPYAGARPVGKGWNTKRRHAGPGRDDTLLVDARGRAVVFGSGEPSGLSTSLPGVLAQLREVIGPHAPVLHRVRPGGAYPVTFTACRDAGVESGSYRRAPLANDRRALPDRARRRRDPRGRRGPACWLRTCSIRLRHRRPGPDGHLRSDGHRPSPRAGKAAAAELAAAAALRGLAEHLNTYLVDPNERAINPQPAHNPRRAGVGVGGVPSCELSTSPVVAPQAW